MFLVLTSFVPVLTASAAINIGDKAPLTDVKMLDVSGEKFRWLMQQMKMDLRNFFLQHLSVCKRVGKALQRFVQLPMPKVGMIVIISNYGSRNNDSYEDMKKLWLPSTATISFTLLTKKEITKRLRRTNHTSRLFI